MKKYWIPNFITFQDLQLLCYANFHLKLTFWTIGTFAYLHKRTLVLFSFWLDFGWSSIEHMSIETPLMSQLKFGAHFLLKFLSSFSLLFLFPLISFVWFVFYLILSLWINFSNFFLLTLTKVHWLYLKVLTPEVSQPTPLKRNLVPRLDDWIEMGKMIYLRWS